MKRYRLKNITFFNNVQPWLNSSIVFLFIFLLPTQLAKHFWPDFAFLNSVRIDYLAPKVYVTDILSLVLIAVNLSPVVQFVKKHRKIVGISSLLFLFNTLFSLSPVISTVRILDVVQIVLLWVVITNLHKQIGGDRFRRLFFQALFIGAVFQFTLALLQLSEKGSLQGVFYWFGERSLSVYMPDVAKASLNGSAFLRPYGTFSHPNSMGGFYLLVYTLSLVDPWLGKKPILRTGLLTVTSILVLVSFSKIVITTYLLVNIAYLFILARKIACVWCLVAKIVVFLVMGAIFMAAQGDQATIEKRVYLAESSLKIISSHVFTGTGLGAYLVAQAEFPMPYSYHFLQPVHNILLLLLTEVGVPLFTFLTVLVIPYVRKHATNTVLIFCSGVIVVTGFFDHYWITLQQNVLLIVVVFAYVTNKSALQESD